MAIAVIATLPRHAARVLASFFSSVAFSALQQPPRQPAATKTFSHIFQQCSTERRLRPGKQAHARMIVSGFTPTIFVSNCLIQMYLRCSCFEDAQKVFDRMLQKDVVSWNTMVSAYAQSGSLDHAWSLFFSMPLQDVVSWNSMMSGLLLAAQPGESVGLYLRMARAGVQGDHATFAIALKSCSFLQDYWLGTQVHAASVRMGLDSNVVTSSALVDMYAKCGDLRESIKLFCEMPMRNSVSWSAIIAGCVQNEYLWDGLQLFIEMQKAGFQVSQSVYASVLRSCAGLSCFKFGQQVHGHAIKCDFSLDTIVGTAVLDMYNKCGRLEDAWQVFQSLPVPSQMSWNAMIIGLGRNDQCLEAVKLFQLMNRCGVGLDETNLSGVFGACAGSGKCIEGKQIHTLAIKTNLDSEISVSNAVLDMYAKSKSLSEALHIFCKMDCRDSVSWNAMIAALEQNGKFEETLLYFDQMLNHGMEPDEFTFGSVLKACGAVLSVEYGLKIHNRVIKFGLGLNSFVGSSLVDMYCKCGVMDEAEKLHSRLDMQTMVSWNAMIAGYSLQKQSEEAQILFSKMLDKTVMPDNFTYCTVLDTCASLASIELGKQMHAQIIKQQLQRDVYISSTLVDMYAKCGNMQDSRLLFEKMPVRDNVSWNALISGYAHHGLGGEAITVFERMKSENIQPNHATFISVLRACGHTGMFDKGINYFQSMFQNYGLEPQLEHYSCMVDLLGRSGYVDKALKLINDMPFEPDATVWRTLLSVCQINKNLEIAELAASSILQLEPDDSSTYILLTNIYTELGKLTEVSSMRRIMRENKLKKEPGCSWIQVKNEVHAFVVGDKAHPQCLQIYKNLKLLAEDIRRIHDVVDTSLFMITI